MPPITKIWQCELKDPRSIDSSEFHTIISEILSLTNSYTNPDSNSDTPQMHVLYQDVRNPSRLLMITGYQSQELNTAADTEYAAKFLPQMLQFVGHKWLRQLELDVRGLFLGETLRLSYGREPDQWSDERTIGSWDVWPQTAQGQQMRANSGKEGVEDKVWVQFAQWDAQDEPDSSPMPVDGETFYLRRFMGR